MEVDSPQRRRSASVVRYTDQERSTIGTPSAFLPVDKVLPAPIFYVKPMVYNKLYHRKAQKGTGLDGLWGTIKYPNLA